MKIGILSDTHNHQPNTRAALDVLRAQGITRLIHCGDVTSGPTVEVFAGWDVTFVFGNMDLDRDELGVAIRGIGCSAPQYSREIELDGRRMAVTHGHDHTLLYRLIMSGKYSYVCHGHTHQRRNEFISAYSVQVINPGALGGNRPEARSVCILDTDSGEAQFIEFPDLS